MCQQFSAEKETPAALGTIRANPVDDIGAAFCKWTEQLRIILGIVLEIGILDQNIFAPSIGKGSSNGGSLAVVPFVKYDSNVAGCRQRLQLLASAIGRAIVDDNNFFFHGRSLDRLQQFLQVSDLVVNWHDYRHASLPAIAGCCWIQHRYCLH